MDNQVASFQILFTIRKTFVPEPRKTKTAGQMTRFTIMSLTLLLLLNDILTLAKN